MNKIKKQTIIMLGVIAIVIIAFIFVNKKTTMVNNINFRTDDLTYASGNIYYSDTCGGYLGTYTPVGGITDAIAWSCPEIGNFIMNVPGTIYGQGNLKMYEGFNGPLSTGYYICANAIGPNGETAGFIRYARFFGPYPPMDITPIASNPTHEVACGSCDNQCDPVSNDWHCYNTTAEQVCEQEPTNGCYHWATIYPCFQGTTCSQGSCGTPPTLSCQIWGTWVSSGQSVTAYQYSSGTTAQCAISQTRTCSGYPGALNGTYQYQSCNIGTPGTCQMSGDSNHDCTINISEVMSLAKNYMNGQGATITQVMAAAKVYMNGGTYT